MRTSFRKWLSLATAAALVLWLPASSWAAAPTRAAEEQEVKAALLFRVAKFIDWPSEAFASASAPFVICVVGSEARISAFHALQGKPLNGRSVAVRRVTADMFDLRRCHAAFFTDDAVADVDYALDKLAGTPVLTVGEAEGFAARGGVLALVTREQRVRFTINLPASKRAGLVVSSQLLKLATVIGAGAQ